MIPPSSVPKNYSDPNRRKAKAVFVVLARNSDLWEIAPSIKQMEDRFNHWAGYDWVFLNDEVRSCFPTLVSFSPAFHDCLKNGT